MVSLCIIEYYTILQDISCHDQVIGKKFKQKFDEYTITEDDKNFKNIVENIKMNSKKILFIFQTQIIYLCNSFKINR